MFEVSGPAGQISIDFNWLRLHGHHRCLPRAAQPDRHPAGGPADGADLYRRRAGAVHAGPALGGDPGFQGMMLLSSCSRWTCCRITASASSVSGGPRDGHVRRDQPGGFIASLMVAAVPIMLAAIGELVVEKAGVLNLGVEGMMIIGAVCGFAAAVETGRPLPRLHRRRAGRGAAVADLRLPDAGAACEPGGDGPGADAVRAGPVLADRAGLCRHQAARHRQRALRPPGRHPGARHDPVRPRSDGLHLDPHRGGGLGGAEIHPHRPHPARGGREPRRAHALGYKVQASAAGDPVRRRDGGPRRGLYQLIRSPGTDGITAGRAGSRGHRGLRQLETLACAARCLSFWRNHRASA